jgi:hypothetical protein
MDGLGAGAVAGGQDALDGQVALVRRGGPEAVGGMGLPDVSCPGVRVAEDGDRADAKPSQGADHPDGDLAAVGYEDGVERWHGGHIRKTP